MMSMQSVQSPLQHFATPVMVQHVFRGGELQAVHDPHSQLDEQS